jgi:hypothetical protein
MAKAKLSGSLLAHRNARLTTEQGHGRPASREMLGDQSFAFPAISSMSLSVGLAIFGTIAAAMLGLVFFTHPSEHLSEPISASNSNLPSPRALGPLLNKQVPGANPASQIAAANTGPVEISVPPSTTPMPAAISAPSIPAAGSDHLRATAATASSYVEPSTSVVAASPEHQSAEARPSTDARLSAAEISALRARGDALFASGDIISARLFYERAADAGDGQAALQLGETYDPAFLKRAGIIGIRGDSTTAKHWYQGASALGASQAQVLLNSATDR